MPQITVSSEPVTAAAVPARRSAFRASLLVAAMIVIAMLRIAGTYRVYNQTIDEPEHIAGGLEWWQNHTFTMDAWHVPLGPAMDAIGPYFSGARIGASGDGKIEGNRYLQGPGTFDDYFHRLTLARIGVLPLFVLAAVIVALWAWRLGGEIATLAATLFFTTTPAVLAHAGLATTDTAAEAATALALFAFVAWFAHPRIASVLVLGVAGGLALSAKVSTIPFLGLAALLIIVTRIWFDSRPQNPDQSRRWWRQPRLYAGFAIAVVLAGAFLWAMYHASWKPYPRPLTLASLTDSGPAPEFWIALKSVRQVSAHGQMRYFLGQIRPAGSHWFFPVALLVKTPLPFLALITIGAIFTFANALKFRDWRWLAPTWGALSILAVGMTANLNLGLRHIQPIFPMLAIVAGIGISELSKLARAAQDSSRKALLALLIALMAWQVVEGALAHPDYLPYFNQFAAGEGDRIMVDSDVDWGQDLWRLRSELAARHIDAPWMAYSGSAIPERFGIHGPDLPFGVPVAGWIVISDFPLKQFPSAFGWLEHFQPVTRVGKSIRLYHIDPSQLQQAAP